MRNIPEHVGAHPFRAFVTVMVCVMLSLTAAGVAIVISLDDQNAANEAVCRSVNELRKEIYVASADLGVPDSVRERFRPSEDCELP